MDAHFPKRHLSAKVCVDIDHQTEEGASDMKLKTMGIDLAKEVF